MRGLKRKLDDLQPAPGANGAAVLHERLRHIDGALLAPARAREAEKERERARELAQLSGKKDEEAGEEGAEAMDVEDDEPEDDDADRRGEGKEKMAAAKARAKAVVDEHFEKKSTSSAGVALDVRDPADRTVDRYIIDHLLRTGRMKTAKTLAASQGIEVGALGSELSEDCTADISPSSTLSSSPSSYASSRRSLRSTPWPRRLHGAARTAVRSRSRA